MNCGYALPLAADDAARPAAGEDEYYKAIIGPKNQDYYLRHFSRFDNEGKAGISWHWPAFLVTFYWLLYRKMWLNAVIYFFLPYLALILFGIIGAVLGDASGLLIGAGYLLYLGGIFIVLPMYANALYYRQCRKTIAEVRATTPDTQRQLGELSGKGGTSSILIIFILIFTFVAFIGILAAIAIPAYQDFTNRSRMVQGVSIGREATASVSGFYDQYRMIPQDLAVTGFAAQLPPAVREVGIDNQTGTISVTMEGAALDGKSVLFVPSLDANDQLVWTCMSEEIQDRYLPHDCRQGK